MSFSVTDAAFEGFRLAREQPRTMLAWAVIYFVASIAVIVAMISVLGPDAAVLGDRQALESMAEADALRLLGKLLQLNVVIIPGALLVGSMVVCAVYRMVLRPDDDGLAYLKFGGDELRMIGLWLVLMLLGVAVLFVSMLILTFARAVPVLESLLVVALLCGWLWFGVRMSLAGPMTFARRKISIAAAWRLTGAPFWRLFGTYLLATIFAFIVGLLGVIIAFALSAIVGGGLGSLGDVTRPKLTSLQDYFSPVRWVYMVVIALVTAMQNVILLAPSAVIYDVLADEPAE